MSLQEPLPEQFQNQKPLFPAPLPEIPPDVVSERPKPKGQWKILWYNLGIFFIYYVVLTGFAVISTSMKRDAPFILYGIYFGHAAVCLLIAVVSLFVKKWRRFGTVWFTSAILLLIIGFGVCTANVLTGLFFNI